VNSHTLILHDDFIEIKFIDKQPFICLLVTSKTTIKQSHYDFSARVNMRFNTLLQKTKFVIKSAEKKLTKLSRF